ncbi:MAG: BREX system serine/threonine kinase PglW [Mesorhizobium sp.]|nr:MAG: BREX system serine/threonine kinase PglW [Mesorhizobium sp.]
MKLPRWTVVSPSAFEWEREALEFLREHLPDHDPWRAWSNFEFVDDEGRVNEVDLLVLSPAGLTLVEVKSRPGTIDGDAHSWIWTTDGRRHTVDNPLLLANRKAKRLASLLKRQDAFGRGANRVPWVTEVIFLSKVLRPPRIDAGTARRVFLRGNPRSSSDSGIIAALTGALDTELGRPASVDANIARTTTRAIEQAGIRPAGRDRRVGDYLLGSLLGEGEGWQDFVARHASLGVARRVRVYPYARAASPDERERLGRMAMREFRVLEGIDHPGILRVLDFRETELGPALVFEHDPISIRLDRFLRERLSELTAEARLGLLRQLAEALGHAHGKRLYHRGLAPQNVLVHGVTEGQPRLQIMNWQVASRAEGSQTAVPVTSGTRNIDDHFSDPAKIYLAPEALIGGEAGAQADVFSLGAIAYHLFTGRPPAESPLDLPAKLREGGGLRLAEAVDGVGTFLEDLVRASTTPIVRDRIASAGEFLEYLALAETDARAQDSTTTVDPSIAKRDDQLDGGFVVLRKLGRGGTADALLVRRNGEEDELVLKVAVDETHGDRLQAEAAVLRRLHHQNIVRIIDTLTVSGRAAILMEKAGDRTLAERLRGDDMPSLDLMRRFGEDLLQALNHLEEQGVAHRDIKPDNIGIAPAGGSGRLRLVLFDFSLTRTPPENLQAGTRPYLDPFLALRPQRRWDLHAERYAAAITLHELVAGVPPTWGDGATEPLVTEDEATIATDRFDPMLREGLRDFFTTALRRNAEERFGNAEDMLREWRRAFEPLDRGAIPEDSIETIARRLDRRSTIAELGYSLEARDVLDRMGVHTVQQLLAVDRIRFRYLRSVSDKVRREIRERAKRLAEIRPELKPGGGSEDAQAWASVDQLAELLIPRRPAGDETAEDRLLELYLGLEPADGPVSWPAAGEVAREAGVARSAVAAVLGKARDRWHKSRELNELRTELVSLLSSAGRVATADELAALLLAARGSVEDSETDRGRLSRAVLRAAIELEASASAAPRFASYADQNPILVALSPELAAHAAALGAIADRMAHEDPLPSPGRVEEELSLVAPPDGEVLPPGRALRLAAAASTGASLSARAELYPKGMAPATALRLSLGSLAGPRLLSEEAVRERVKGRFPDAAQLPPRPELDRLLDEVGAERIWSDDDPDGRGYVSRFVTPSDRGSRSSALRYGTLAAAPQATPEVLDARALEEKIVGAGRSGAFLALTVDPRRASRAEAELLRRFAPRERVSLELLLLREMRAEAEARKVKWPVVLAADAEGHDGKGFRNLLRLATKAAERVRATLLAFDRPALLVSPGLLARYDLMTMLSDLAQASGTRGGPPSLWLLVPQPDGGMPRIDDAYLPVMSAANWARLTDPWLANAHRAGGAQSAA